MIYSNEKSFSVFVSIGEKIAFNSLLISWKVQLKNKVFNQRICTNGILNTKRNARNNIVQMMKYLLLKSIIKTMKNLIP